VVRVRNHIQEARAKRRHSIRDMAAALGIPPTGLSRLERGLQALTPRMATLLEPYCGVTAMELLVADAADQLDRYRAENAK
jgi:plasmid maintenance system antidote protein VapI